MFGECHAHIFMNGYNYRKAVEVHKDKVQDSIIREHLQAYREAKVDFVRDGGDALGVSKRCQELAEEYGIDYRTPIFAIHKKGHYGGIVGREFSDFSEYRDLVKSVDQEGGDFIKIMVSGIVDFSEYGKITEEPVEAKEIREMIKIAHDFGFSVMVHANGKKAVLEAADAQADSIEHGRYIDRECIDAMAQNQCVWVPTIVTVKNLIGCGRFEDKGLYQIYKDGCEEIRYAYQHGVQMALGSDAGAYRVFHGQGIIDEYHCFQEILGKSKNLDSYLKNGEKQIRSFFS